MRKFSEIFQIEMLDEHLASYFEDMTVSGLFEDSVVIVMSDHGNRFDAIRFYRNKMQNHKCICIP